MDNSLPKNPISLPNVSLKDKLVSLKLINIIPPTIAHKYSAVFFDEDNETLRLAVGYPERLKRDFNQALEAIARKLGKKVVIYRATPWEIDKILQTSPPVKTDNALVSPKSPEKATEASYYEPLPKLYIKGEIPLKVFKKIPFNFSEKFHLICVDFIPPNKFNLAAAESQINQLKPVISHIKRNNPVELKIFRISDREFTYLLNEYRHILRVDQKPIKAKEESLVDISQSFKGPEKVNERVVKPEIKGKIISSDKEKIGVAGVFEKIGSFLAPRPALVSPPRAPINQAQPPKSTPPDLEPKFQPAKIKVQEDFDRKIEEREPASTEEVKKEKSATKEDLAEKNRVITEDNDLGKLLTADVKDLKALEVVIKENNIPKILAAIISFAIFQNASDIHLEPFDDELLIRYRIDGQLRNIIELPPDMHAPLISRIKILSKLKLDETRIPQDGRFDVKFSSREVDLRVSTMPAIHGEKGVLRILDKSKGIISLESLGVEGDSFDLLVEAINRPFGIIMATGPTGSGKSTTLYAILARVATSNVNVITLEDPVEYEMKGVNQSQINPKIGYTFADGLRSILRQDPNIIMVGEIRDGETANMATQAALTGHLVLSTLHTNDASGALPRLINMGIEPFLITSSINAIIGQRLVRKVCQNCKEEVNLPTGVIKEVEEEIAKISPNNKKDRSRILRPFKFFEGKGCDQCNHTGYSGRIGVYEILPMTEGIEALTIEHATANQILEKSTAEGMITMKQDGILKVLSGATTLDEVLRETSNK